MHKPLLLLGLLLKGPKYGYELNRIVRAHGELYADLKKANLYHLLERLAAAGYLTVTSELGARGRRGERLVYELTERGRAHFHELLRDVLRSYEAAYIGVEVAVVFLNQMPPAEAIALLEERRQGVLAQRSVVEAEMGAMNEMALLTLLAADHLLALMEAEIAWLDRTLTRLQSLQQSDATSPFESCGHEGAD